MQSSPRALGIDRENALPATARSLANPAQALRPQVQTALGRSLSGRAMRDGIGFLGLCNFNHPLRNQWPRDARAEKILVLVNSSGLKHRKNEIAREFFPQVLYDTFGCAGAERFLFDTFKLLFLTDIGTEGDDISLIIFLQLTQNDRGIEPAGVC
jgi:hypothetical protein